MNRRITKRTFSFLRWGVTLLFLLSLFAIDFDNPRDIISITTLNRLIHPGLLWQVVCTNTAKLTNLLKEARPEYIAGAFFIHLICIAMLAFRWQLLLRAQSICVSFLRLYAYYLIGFFFNNFLPSNIGGDISRVYNAGKHQGKITESFGVVFLERLIGFVAVFFLALISILFHSEWLKNYSSLYSILLFAAVIALIFWALFDRRIRRRIKALISKVGFMRLNEKLSQFYQSVYLFRDKVNILFGVLILSALYQFTLVFVNLFAAYAVGARPPVLPLFFVIQISTLICVIPISINGLGVREYLYVQFLAMAGIAADQTMAFQIILFVVFYMESLVGGLCFLLQKLR